MKGIQALNTARVAGVRVEVDGHDLSLAASETPPIEILELLRRHKAEIIPLLSRGCDGWTGEDWFHAFEERSAIIEHDDGLSRLD